MAHLKNNLHIICKSKDLVNNGTGHRFFVKIQNEVKPAFVVRFAGKPNAFLNECAHQAVELDFVQGNFFDSTGNHLICATHGALYDPVTGVCVGGRCDGRGLKLLRTIEKNKNICFVVEAGIDFVTTNN